MKIVRKYKYLLAIIGLLATQAYAQIRYDAPLGPEAKKLWSNNSTKVTCSLIFDIPSYGFANFTTHSGRNLRSSLTLHPKLGIADSSFMRFIATKPEWHSTGSEKLLGKIELYPGFNPYVGPTLAWRLLSELSHGNQILLPYTDKKYAGNQNIIPSLSPLGFNTAYKNYLSCQEQLLRVNFNDIKMMPFVFKLKEAELTAKSLMEIKQQIEYLKVDPSINKIVIRAYAYDMGSKSDNSNMAKDRAEAIKKLYTDAGIDENIVSIVPFNTLTLNTKEEDPIVDESVTSRNALVTVERDNALINKELEVNVPDVGANSGEW